MASDKILTSDILSGVTADPVTGSTVGNKRGLDVAVVSGAPAQATRLDEASATITYVGKASVGSESTDSVWQIQRITVSGTETIIEWADGNSEFDNQWSARSGLSYS